MSEEVAPIHFGITLENDQHYYYRSRQTLNALTSNLNDWFSEDVVIERTDNSEDRFNDIHIEFGEENTNLFEFKLHEFNGINMGSLGASVISNLNLTEALKTKISNQHFTVTYSDVYNNSAFSMVLSRLFVESVCKTINSELVHYRVLTSNMQSRSNGRYITDPILSFSELQEFGETNDVMKGTPVICPAERLPHYRIFEFKAETGISFSIRIDGGIQHGLRPKHRIYFEQEDLLNPETELVKMVDYELIYTLSVNTNVD
jgi:disulfide oxidoreductase YuzD